MSRIVPVCLGVAHAITLGSETSHERQINQMMAQAFEDYKNGKYSTLTTLLGDVGYDGYVDADVVPSDYALVTDGEFVAETDGDDAEEQNANTPEEDEEKEDMEKVDDDDGDDDDGDDDLMADEALGGDEEDGGKNDFEDLVKNKVSNKKLMADEDADGMMDRGVAKVVHANGNGAKMSEKEKQAMKQMADQLKEMSPGDVQEFMSEEEMKQLMETMVGENLGGMSDGEKKQLVNKMKDMGDGDNARAGMDVDEDDFKRIVHEMKGVPVDEVKDFMDDNLSEKEMAKMQAALADDDDLSEMDPEMMAKMPAAFAGDDDFEAVLADRNLTEDGAGKGKKNEGKKEQSASGDDDDSDNDDDNDDEEGDEDLLNAVAKSADNIQVAVEPHNFLRKRSGGKSKANPLTQATKWIPEDKFWKTLHINFENFSEKWGKRLKCVDEKDEEGADKCETKLIKWALRPEAGQWKKTFLNAEATGLTHLKSELATALPTMKETTKFTTESQIQTQCDTQVQNLIGDIKASALENIAEQAANTKLQCTDVEKGQIQNAAKSQFEEWWKNNKDGLQAQLAAGTKNKLGGELAGQIQEAASSIIQDQIGKHHVMLGHVLNQMRKDVRSNFKKLEQTLWDAQAKQWKKEFLAKLTDRMQTTVELMNEYFVTNQLPAQLNTEIGSRVSEALSGDQVKQQAISSAESHLKNVVQKSVDFATAQVLQNAHAKQLKELTANWQL